MTLRKFVKKYVNHNAIIRLLVSDDVPDDYRYTIIHSRDNRKKSVGMAYDIIDGTGWQAYYANWKFVCVTSTLCDDNYPDAISIVIREDYHGLRL